MPLASALPSSPAPAPVRRERPLRIGFLALTDAAPIAVAQEQGLFTRHGLQVELHREIGWATIREKIIYGELDAAQAPAPMLWSAQLGLGCVACEVQTALVLSLNGNALTLSRALRDEGVVDAVTLREHARRHRSATPLTFGVVFPFSSHQLLLRNWLRAAGLEPERDVRIVVVPPAQMFRNLAAGTIDGFCSGEPWNSLAVREGAGWCPAWSAVQDPGHVEKVLLVTRRFADTRPAEHRALVRALTEAAAWCDEPQHREGLADLLAQSRYLNLPARVIAPSLLDRFDCGHAPGGPTPGFHVFHRGDAGVPAVAKAAALQDALLAAGLVPAGIDRTLPGRLFRADLHHSFTAPSSTPHEIQHSSDSTRSVGQPA